MVENAPPLKTATGGDTWVEGARKSWTAADMGDARALRHHLTPEQIEAINAAVRSSEQYSLDAVHDHFAKPAIKGLMVIARERIMRGPGAIVLTGLEPDSYTPAQFAKVFFGLGTHLGRIAPQFRSGDALGEKSDGPPRARLLGVVREEPNGDAHGYQSTSALGPHTDFHEILGLACAQPAESGGETLLVNSVAVCAALHDRHPAAVAALCEGYYHPRAADRTTADKIPCISIVDGAVSAFNHNATLFAAARIRGESLPDDMVDALLAFDTYSRMPEFGVSFLLKPGEMLFWHNFLLQHGRSAFINSNRTQRRLLRLWIHPEERRPMAPGFIEMGEILDDLHGTERTSYYEDTEGVVMDIYRAHRKAIRRMTYRI